MSPTSAPPVEGSPKILFVDDEPKTCKYFQRLFGESYQIVTSTDPLEGLRLAKLHGDFQIVISDQRMPSMAGVEFLHEIQRISKRSVRILSTAYSDYPAVVEAINTAQVFAYFSKPWEIDFIERTLNRSIKLYECGNAVDFNISVNDRSPSEISTISISLEDTRDLQSILSISQSLLSRRSSPALEEKIINLVKTKNDLVISFEDPETGSERLASLESFRQHIEHSSDIDRAILSPTGTSISHQQAEVAISRIGSHSLKATREISGVELLPLKNTLDGLQSQLAKLLTEVHSLKKIERIKPGRRLVRLSNDLEDLIKQTRLLCGQSSIDQFTMDTLHENYAQFLDEINNNKNSVRGLLVDGCLNPSTINVIFVLFNALPSKNFSVSIEPDLVMMNLARTATDKSENRFMLLIFVIFGFVASMIMFFALREQNAQDSSIAQLMAFSFVVVLASTIAICTTKMAGKIGLEGNIPFPWDATKSLSIKSTSGFAVFVLILAAGTWIAKG